MHTVAICAAVDRLSLAQWDGTCRRAYPPDRSSEYWPNALGLIAKKGPPRLCWPSAWCGQVTRYRGLGDREPEHEKVAMYPRRTQREFSRAIRTIN